MSVLSTYLKHIRNEKGLSLRGFADLIGVDPSSLSRLERGEVAFPSNELLTKIAVSLGRPEAEVYLSAGRIAPKLVERLEREMPMAVLQISRVLDTLATVPDEYAMPEEDDDPEAWMAPEDEAAREVIHQGYLQVGQLSDAVARGIITLEQFERVTESIRQMRLALVSPKSAEKP